MKLFSIQETLIKNLLIITISFISQFSFSQTNVTIYNLETFINTVRENNLQLKISKNKSRVADLSIKEAMSALLPQINGQTEIKRNLNDQFIFFEAPDFGNIDPITGEVPQIVQRFKTNFNNEFQANILLEQNLFSLKNIYNLKSARQFSNIGKLQNEDQIIKIIAEAKKAFLQTVLIKNVYKVSEVSELYAKENYLASKNKYENKLISELDLLQAKIRWEEELPKLLKAKRNYLMLLGNLKLIAGINPTDNIVIDYDLAAYELKDAIVNSDDAINNRIDYQLLEANNYLQELDIKNKQAEYYPTLNLRAGYSYFSSSDEWAFKDNQNKIIYTAVTFTVPIFSGGFRKSQLSKAKILSNITSLEKQEAKLSMTIEIQNLELKLSEEYKTIQVATSTRETAKKAYEIAVETAKIGLISQIDLRKISDDYNRAEINLYNSIYNFKCTQIDFNNAIANY
ncbi:TolC family protein [Winogradskyella sp. UBA3174]|uniref:TolC family protein n=1 Tax=Winogradskyella sp. UBA3174 TaxID=1947785 RepID=UPI0025F9F181|nr:TolC family protein [Winogradskyella sp. UBA3174]|tara:strand:+ start:826 stop:2193 length:1368 start_codon:yes stop_codon:yes gene_type:complete